MCTIPLDPTTITVAWPGHVLQADVRGCRLEQIAIGVGLLGRLFRVHLDGGPDVPATVVVKLPTADARARKTICEDLEFYLREVRFYQEIGVANPLQPARPYAAAFDEATKDFVLVLEDLERLRLANQIAGCSAADAETVIDAGRIDVTNDRHLELLRTMTTGAVAAIEDHDLLALRPD